jgi:hypothetical protein
MAKKKASLYSVHPSVKMVQDWIDNLEEQTGCTLDGWMELIQAEGPKDEKARREWLRTEHRFGANSAWWLAERAQNPRAKGEEDPDVYLARAEQYVEAMFAGKKAHLRPTYEALLALGRSLGRDLKFCPCKTMVPFYREHVVAEVKPATLKRIDFGLALGKTKVPKTSRLIDTGGAAKKDRITHRFELATPDDVDAEVRRWTKVAYDLDA